MTAVTGWGIFVTYKLQRVIAMATEQIRVESGVLQRALKHTPKYLNITGWYSLLIDKAVEELDKGDKIMDSERERAFHIHRDDESKREEGISTETEKKAEEVIQKAKKKSSYTKVFEKFWSIYQSSPNKSGGSKVQAFTEWKKALKDEPAERLIKALVANIEEQRLKEGTDTFCPTLKQAHGWLSKKDYSSWLDVVTVKQQVQNGIKVYD